ncbi:MAG: amidohydrolase family protein [Dehalococcoidales bacterium]|nr:amidohydrolase family protein [Dehalococcoidales bacterium]
MMNGHEEWLALTREDPVDPELPICDAHHHLWDMPGWRYLLTELFRDLDGGHNIVRTVFVENESVRKKGILQPLEPVEETRFVHALTASDMLRQYGRTRVAGGIVGFADFTLGSAVATVLEAHMAASDRFRSVRQMANWSEDRNILSSAGGPGLLSEGKFREGFAALKNYDLVFETFLFHPQLSELADLARTFPGIPIILEHAGGPIGIGLPRDRNAVMKNWKKGMAGLAQCPNVSVKLGGLGMPVCGFGWHERPAPPGSEEIAEAITPCFTWCLEQFGVQRCMFESNFPVDRTSYSYTLLWNAYKHFSRSFSSEERDALFMNTAVKKYRL